MTIEITSLMDTRMTVVYDHAYADTPRYRAVPAEIREKVDIMLSNRNVVSDDKVAWLDREIIRLLSPYALYTPILDADLSKVTEFMANSAHPGKDRTSGFFGFAGHNDPVAFRNIQIKPL